MAVSSAKYRHVCIYKMTLAMVKCTCLWFWLFLLVCLILSGIGVVGTFSGTDNHWQLSGWCYFGFNSEVSGALPFCTRIMVGSRVRQNVLFAKPTIILEYFDAEMDSPLGGEFDHLVVDHEVLQPDYRKVACCLVPSDPTC